MTLSVAMQVKNYDCDDINTFPCARVRLVSSSTSVLARKGQIYPLINIGACSGYWIQLTAGEENSLNSKTIKAGSARKVYEKLTVRAKSRNGTTGAGDNAECTSH